jgi:hypothetical protein
VSASAGSSPDSCREANHYSLPFAMLPTGTKRQIWTTRLPNRRLHARPGPPTLRPFFCPIASPSS